MPSARCPPAPRGFVSLTAAPSHSLPLLQVSFVHRALAGIQTFRPAHRPHPLNLAAPSTPTAPSPRSRRPSLPGPASAPRLPPVPPHPITDLPAPAPPRPPDASPAPLHAAAAPDPPQAAPDNGRPPPGALLGGEDDGGMADVEGDVQAQLMRCREAFGR